MVGRAAPVVAGFLDTASTRALHTKKKEGKEANPHVDVSVTTPRDDR